MGGGQGFRGGFGGDPNTIWNFMAQGKEVITRNDIDPQRFDRMAQNMGITSGQISRQQFVDYMQQRMANRGNGGGGPGNGWPQGGGRGGDPSGWAESSFQRLDQNGDGLLNYDEMPESLRVEREKWDTNKDGFIDLNEYKAYIQARVQQMRQERGMGGMGMDAFLPPGSSTDDEEEKKPVVYRVGSLPKGLPAWFTELDEDEDAQIGVYEWKRSGRSMAEFNKIDRNGDGFLTVDEVLRYVGQPVDGNGDSGGSPGTRGSFAGGPPSFGGNGGPGGPPRFGGWGGGGPGAGMWGGGGPPGGGQWGNRGGGGGPGAGRGGMDRGGRQGGGFRPQGMGGDRDGGRPKGKDRDRSRGNG
jgi:Ca2+-binding EF-hand superfamily protein